ncbi:MAG: MFS transporter [Pseudomonadota bacterium]|nr:MFS transporter [Pseudomonadota bacterium]
MNPARASAAQGGLEALIDRQSVGAPLIRLCALGALCMIMDGFDAQVIGFVAPAIVEDWKISPSALGPVFSIGLLGMVIGSLAISPLADRHGRRPVLILSVTFFGLCVLATNAVHTMRELLIMRLVTGLGLGATVPNVLALVSEFTPARHRSAAVMIMAACFTVGAAVGGYNAAWMIPAYGWRSLFVLGGAIPLLVAVSMFVWLPESAKLLALTGAASTRIKNALGKIYAQAAAGASDASFLSVKSTRAHIPVAELFRDGRLWPTILIWLLNFINLLQLYFLSNWLPTLLRSSHLTMKTAVTTGTFLQVGGLTGALVLALLTRRFRLITLLTVNFCAAAVAIFALGQTMASPAWVLLPIFAAGFCVIGGQPAISAITAEYYPTSIRSSGVGWSLGIGRIGSIAGPLVGGLFLAMNWGNGRLFLTAAIPSLIASCAVLMLARAGGGGAPGDTHHPPAAHPCADDELGRA